METIKHQSKEKVAEEIMEDLHLILNRCKQI